MRGATDYNDAVRRLFARPEHAGDLPAKFERVLRSTAAEPDQSVTISMEAGLEGGRIAALAYRVHGCPHLIAALELFCSRFADSPATGLENPDFADITRELAIPVEKSGRILLLEDAVAGLFEQYDGARD